VAAKLVVGRALNANRWLVIWILVKFDFARHWIAPDTRFDKPTTKGGV
jgi:hypothetical protein